MSKRGFGSPNYDPAKAKAAQQKGNRVLRAQGKCHLWNHDEATEAGIKGGAATAQRAADRRAATDAVPEQEAA